MATPHAAAVPLVRPRLSAAADRQRAVSSKVVPREHELLRLDAGFAQRLPKQTTSQAKQRVGRTSRAARPGRDRTCARVCAHADTPVRTHARMWACLPAHATPPTHLCEVKDGVVEQTIAAHVQRVHLRATSRVSVSDPLVVMRGALTWTLSSIVSKNASPAIVSLFLQPTADPT